MIWVRYYSTSWWVRWLLLSALLMAPLAAGIAGVIANRGVPGGVWVWVLPAIVVVALGSAALISVLYQPVVSTYAAVIRGLDTNQRAQLVAAPKPGPLPEDPVVLAAVVRAGKLARLYSSRRPLWVRWLVIAVGAVYAAWTLTVPDLAGLGIVLLIVEACAAASLAWGMLLRARRKPRMAQLAAAAAADSEAAALIAAADPIVAPRTGVRRRLCAVAGVILYGGGWGLVAVLVMTVPVQSADCRTADAAINYIHDQRTLLDSAQITISGPALSTYQEWSDQLGRYAAEASRSDIKRYIQHLADLAGRATHVVEQVRQQASLGPTDVTIDSRDEYSVLAQQIVDAEQPLLAACH